MNLITAGTLNSIINSLGSTDIESGGLIGSSDGSAIDAFFYDAGIDCSAKEYNPDIESLQDQLLRWDEENIRFCGIIHSHADDRYLSNKDVSMARRILENNPLDSILMPVFLLKDKSIIWYEVEYNYVKHLIFETI